MYIYIHIYVRVCVYTCIHIYTYMYMHICMCVCIYMYMYEDICTYIYTYIQSHIFVLCIRAFIYKTDVCRAPHTLKRALCVPKRDLHILKRHKRIYMIEYMRIYFHNRCVLVCLHVVFSPLTHYIIICVNIHIHTCKYCMMHIG